MKQTKLKVALVAMALLAAGLGGMVYLGIKDKATWIAWIGSVSAVATQYSAANWAITHKALHEGKTEK